MNFKYLLFFLIFGLSACASDQNNKNSDNSPRSVVLSGKIAPKGKFENIYYSFQYAPANKIFEETEWKNFKDNNNPKSAIIVIGTSSLLSYALSVTTNKNPDKIALVDFVKKEYPKIDFSPNDLNPLCISTNLEKPIQLSKNMLTFIAKCYAPGSTEVYELQISEQSAVTLANSKKGIRTENTEKEYQKSMSIFINTFQIKTH